MKKGCCFHQLQVPPVHLEQLYEQQHPFSHQYKPFYFLQLYFFLGVYIFKQKYKVFPPSTFYFYLFATVIAAYT